MIRAFLRLVLPLPAKRFAGRILTALRIPGNAIALARLRGARYVWESAVDHVQTGAGVRRFNLWCRESLARERRDDREYYQAWLGRSGVTVATGYPGSPVDGRCHAVQWPAAAAAANGQEQGLSASGRIQDSMLELLSGSMAEFLLFMHADAELEESALQVLVSMADQTGADLVYADEDRIGPDGPHKPFFKPGFSIDLHRSCDYIGPVCLVRRETALAALGNTSSHDLPGTVHELALLMYEDGNTIAHAPRVLVHWTHARPRTLSLSQTSAVMAHLNRMYGRVDPSAHLVSIIIPTKDRMDLLESCIDSIYATDSAFSYEIIVLDNRSQEDESMRWLAEAPSRYENLRVVPADYPFNWSRLNNDGIRSARGDLILFLNNDIEVRTPRWLELLAVQALRPDVGAVGALLLYPSGEVQHAGVVVGIGRFADHVYAGCSPDPEQEHVFAGPMLTRNVLVVTGACLMVHRSKLEAVGGFNEDLKICGDVEMCTRLYEHGYLNVYESRVRLIHHESATRSRAPLRPDELRKAVPHVARYLEQGDPFYSPNLSLNLRYPMFEV
jgi:O-antigen biosynthesis protein